MLRAALAIPGLLIAVLVGAQLALPRLAERRVTGDLEASGEVQRVSIEAFPAVKLLWGRADRVEVCMPDARAGAGRLAELLRDARGVGELDARIAILRIGPLVLRDVELAKRDDRIRTEASVTEADLAAALPRQLSVRAVGTSAGQLVIEAAAGPVAVRAALLARDGAIVIAPEGLLGGLGALTVFRDRRVIVDAVGSRPRADGFTLTASGRLASS